MANDDKQKKRDKYHNIDALLSDKNTNKDDPNTDKIAVVHHEDMDFVSDSKAVVLSQTYRHANVLLYIVIAFITIAIIWATTTKLEQITIGAGRVIPSGKIKVIQNLEGGIVQQINVKDGDIVKKGEVLVRLDATRFNSDYREVHSNYLTLLANVSRLRAESSGDQTILFPAILEKEAPQLVVSETLFFEDRQTDLTAKITNLRDGYLLAEQELQIVKPLVEQQVMSKLELLRLEREVNELKGQMDETLEDFKGKAHAQLNEKKAELVIAKEKMISAEDRMNRTVIRSPVNGVVKSMNISTLGEVIKSGDNIIEIVPMTDQLTVEVDVKPSDIAFIHPEAKALVKITAYDYAVYGGLPATVESISADTIQDEKGNHFYKVKIRTEQNYLDKEGNKLPIMPGMTATVNIITNKKSVLSYIMKPILRAREAAFKER